MTYLDVAVVRTFIWLIPVDERIYSKEIFGFFSFYMVNMTKKGIEKLVFRRMVDCCLLSLSVVYQII